MFASHGRWLYCDDQPRVWFARRELEATEHAPTTPLEEWSDTQTPAAMIEAVSMRADIKEVCAARQ